MLPWIAAAGLLDAVAIFEILARTGEPAAPLDDAYIHLQYARSFADLRPLVYSPGAAPAPGATSLLWPALLAPFFALGLRGASLLWVAWGFGLLAHGLLAYEAYRAASPVMSKGAALAAGAMVVVFGGHVWNAVSGMEVLPFAWLLMRTARRASEMFENAAPRRSDAVELATLGVVAPLMRPEGALAAVVATAAVIAASRRGAARAWILPPALGPLLPSATNLLFTGSTTSTTVQVKWLLASPYAGDGRALATIADNLTRLFGTLLDGREHAWVFLPTGGAIVFWLALPALLGQGVRHRRLPRALILVVLALGMTLPASYDSFLWNRLRYLWPFAAFWFVGAAALADGLSALARRWHAELPEIGPLLGGAFAGALAARLSFAIDDVADSAAAITNQQVALGRWVRQELPAGSRVGLNDAGAIAYFGQRETFDVVGLTTRGEARFWAAGAGSRFEHYERLEAGQLPTHFAVYPGWFAIPPLLGRFLTARHVEATILGGTTKVVHEADYRVLRSGHRPSLVLPPAREIDRLDVADLESEAAHGYQLLAAAAHENVVILEHGKADGARLGRTLERFWLELCPGGSLVLRLGAQAPVSVMVTAAGRRLGTLALSGKAWEETQLPIPPDLPAGRQPLELSADGRFSALHYFSFGPPGIPPTAR